MGQQFRDEREGDVQASPEQVWEAITTGPGVDAWFMGETTIEPGAGGAVRTDHGSMSLTSTITAWEPLRRFAHQGEPGADGRFVAYEFLIEGRGGSATTVRLATAGFLPGDDWEDEYEVMISGGALYFHTLMQYLTYFPGRRAVPVSALSASADRDRAWPALLRALRVQEALTAGRGVRLAPDGLEPINGTVDYVTPEILGVRSVDGLYRFYRGFFAPGIGHHLFGTDAAAEAGAWHSWLQEIPTN